jgi:hypothetical protein
MCIIEYFHRFTVKLSERYDCSIVLNILKMVNRLTLQEEMAKLQLALIRGSIP